MRDTPQHYSDKCYDANEPLDAGEFVFHGPDGDDGGSFAGLEGYEEEDPD